MVFHVHGFFTFRKMKATFGLNKFLNSFLLKHQIIFLVFSLSVAVQSVYCQSIEKESKTTIEGIRIGELMTEESQQVLLLNKLAGKSVNQNPDSAIVYAEEALSLIPDSTQFEEQLNAYKTLAQASYVLGNSKNSYEYSVKVVEIAGALDDEVSKLFGQVYLGLTFLLQNRFREAIDEFKIYRALATDLEDSSSLSRAYLDLSISYEALFSFDTALVYVDSCIDVGKQIDDKYYLGMGFNRKGYILSNMEQYDSAISNHKKSLSVIEDNNDWERAFAYAGLAKAYSGIKDFDNSVDFGEKGLELAYQMNAKWEIKNASEILAEAYAKSGDFKNAYKYQGIFKSYHDSIFTEENERRINEIQLRQAQTERDALKQENKLQSQILSQKNVLLMLMVAIAVILVALLIVLYFTIKNRRKYTEELALQRDKLNEINKSKDRILSILAHDMRSPINSILQLLYLMKHEKDANLDFDVLMDEVFKRTSTISNTLNNLLDWSVSQFQNSEAVTAVVNVVEIMEEQINLCSYDAEQKQIKLNHNKENAQSVMVQVEHLRIILRNLIANAIKYSYEKSTIYLEYAESGGWLFINVRDEGTGMSEKTLASLFASKSYSSTGTKNEIGTGLGLFICKEYATMNHGDLKVESEEGKGSTFKLMLPLA